MNESNHHVGLQLVYLSHFIENLKSLKDFYQDVEEKIGDISELSDQEDCSIRYMSVQHFSNLELLNKEDLEDHCIGFGIKIFRRDVVLNHISEYDNLIAQAVSIVKDRICKYLGQSKNSFDGPACHYFMGSRIYVYFKIRVEEYCDRIIILDAYLGDSPDIRREDILNRYKSMIDFEL